MSRYGLLCLCLLGSPLMAMQMLDDESLAGVSGQGGISVEISGGGWAAQSVDYSQDGQILRMEALSNRPVDPASSSLTTLDVVDEQLHIVHQGRASELNVGAFGFAGSDNSFGALRLFYTLGASLLVRGGGAVGDSGLGLNDSQLSLQAMTLYYRDNGFDLIVRDASLEAYVDQAALDVIGGDGHDSVLRLGFGNSRLVAHIGAINLDLAQGDPEGVELVTPDNPDTRYADFPRSFGQFDMDMRLGGSIDIAAGGATGEGLRFIPDVTISDSLFQYKDDGLLRAENLSGLLRSQSGVTLDLDEDGRGRYVQLAFQDLKLNASLGGLIIGNPSNQKIGSLALDLNFQDQGARQNWFKLRPGGDPNSGLQGIRADVSWNMVSSSVSLTDNGNSMWFSGLRTHGVGQLTLDLTRSCAGGVSTGCYAGSVDTQPGSGGYDGHFDGLRLGLKNVSGGYSFDGLRVGGADAPLQGGTELLVLLEIFPAYDFTLNGQLTLRPGGASGDGVRYNADFFVTDANAAITVDETGRGLWLAGTRYDMHFRDGSLDVTQAGVQLSKGTYWSTLDVHDVRWGDRAAGQSLGRIVLRRYEQGSTLSLSSGGAGALCVGGSGSNASACAASGGRWEDRGNEGLTAGLKNVFVRDASGNPAGSVSNSEKRNQLIIETDRVNGVDGTGAQLVVDNFYTSDANPGDANANSYGVRVDLNLDVAPTSVCDKSTSGCPPVSPDPLGFAVNGRVHFKEINIDRIQNVHPSGGAVTSMYGIKLQNADIRANLTATPMN